jgi:pSer/pThr/pTyr-binding forkhead associated (FHA) protein
MIGVIVLILRILLTAALYLFLILIMYTIWRDLHQQVKKTAENQIPGLVLVDPLSQKDYSTFAGQKEVLIGRKPDCSLVVDKENISATHAALTYHHKQWWISDLNSTNGTFLNDDRLSEPTVIMAGDQIRCGNHAWTIEIKTSHSKKHKSSGE